MKLAIISDVHLGDPLSVMARRCRETGIINAGEYYDAFRNAIMQFNGGAPLDYLVLLGDILDFSVTSYNEAYSIGRYFFQQVRDDGLAREIIYIPGNHDFDLWHTVEYQVNITNRIICGKLPEPFRMSVPGIIDDRRPDGGGKLVLHSVKVRGGEMTRYAGLFLDSITHPVTPFNFVYPNLYLVPSGGQETILITHGQYLEPYWSILGEWALRIAGNNLELRRPLRMNLKEMVALNFPMSQLACIGTGQAGPLTREIQKVESEVREHSIAREWTGSAGFAVKPGLARVREYIARIEEEVEKLTPGFWGWLKRLPLTIGKRKLLEALNTVETSRYNIEFMNKPVVRERFKRFFQATLEEMGELNGQLSDELPSARSMIFGHTHQPIPWGSPDAPFILPDGMDGDSRFYMYNSGGWLNKVKPDNSIEFCGAEIFFYSSWSGMSSVRIG